MSTMAVTSSRLVAIAVQCGGFIGRVMPVHRRPSHQRSRCRGPSWYQAGGGSLMVRTLNDRDGRGESRQ
ncbi:MAG TPA: hypothetical protein VGD53_02065 [Actinoallomurus sp.]